MAGNNYDSNLTWLRVLELATLIGPQAVLWMTSKHSCHCLTQPWRQRQDSSLLLSLSNMDSLSLVLRCTSLALACTLGTSSATAPLAMPCSLGLLATPCTSLALACNLASLACAYIK